MSNMYERTRQLFEADVRAKLRGQYPALPVTSTDTTIEKPPYPFVSVKYISLGEKVGQASKVVVGDVRHHKQINEFVMSVNCYHNNEFGAIALAQSMIEYFEVTAPSTYYEQGIVIVSTSELSDRTTFLDAEYEYRIGFDVTFRATHSTIDAREFIEEVRY